MPILARPRIEYRTPEDLVDEVRRGVLRIPSFQRGFRWEATDVVKLFDSIARGYPVGNLLLWRRPAPAQQLTVGTVTIEAEAMDDALWVVDGQQRITSLAAALLMAETTTDTRFRVHFDLDTAKFHTIGSRQHPPVAWIPVSTLHDTKKLLAWMRTNVDWLSDEQVDLAELTAKAIREYQVPTYVVTTPDEDSLVDIFSRMNTTGKPLTKPEVFHALHSSMTPGPPASLAALGRKTGELDFGAIGERLALRCLLAFRGGDIFREDFTDEFDSTADRVETFREVGVLLREVVTFLRTECGISHARLLPYSHALPVLVRFNRIHGVPTGRTATLLRRWVWRGAVAGTRAGGVSKTEVRSQVGAVEAANTVDAAQALLSQVRQYPDFTPELDKLHFRHAMAKINVLGLLSVGPRRLDADEPVDVTRLLGSESPLRRIIPNESSGLASTMANRALAVPGRGRSLLAELKTAPPSTQESHLVDRPAYMFLIEERYHQFLRYRAYLVAEAITAHVSNMAEWGARDGRAVVDMIRPVA